MLVVGVCGISAHDIASRLTRHVSGAEFLAPTNASTSLEVSVLRLVHEASKLRKHGYAEPNFVMLVVDPPPKNSVQYGPLNKLLASKPDSLVIPFYLHEEPMSSTALTGRSTFFDFCETMKNATGYHLEISGEGSDTVLDVGIAQNISAWQRRELPFRSLITDEERSEMGLGDGVVMTFTAVKGGSGKSSLALIAANILTNWALEMQRSVLLLDCNLGQPVLAGLTWGRPRKDIRWAISQIEEGAAADDVLSVVANPLSADTRGSKALGGGGKIHAVVSRLNEAGRSISLQPEALYELVTAAARKYDYVIVDAPPIDPTTATTLSDRFVLPVSDKIVFVCDSEYTSTQNAIIHFRDLMAHNQGLEEHCGFVVNKLDEHTQFEMSTMHTLVDSFPLYNEQSARILGSVPYYKDLKQSFNVGSKGLVPEIPAIDKAVASVLEKVLNLEAGRIAPLSVASAVKSSGRGFFNFKKKQKN